MRAVSNKSGNVAVVVVAVVVAVAVFVGMRFSNDMLLVLRCWDIGKSRALLLCL